MKNACPLKTSEDWVASEKVFGEDNTWKLWIDSSDGSLLDPLKGGFYFFIESEPIKASELLNKHIPLSKRQNFNNSTSLTDIIAAANDEMFKNQEYLQFLKSKDFSNKIENIQEKIEAIKEAPKKTKMQELEEVKGVESFIEPINPLELQEKIRSNQLTYAIASASERVIPFEIINSEDAEVILKGSNMIYYGQPAFIYEDKVYYVKDNISTRTRLADMSIGFIAAYRGVTANKKQFQRLYDSVSTSATGSTIIENVKALYPKIKDYKSDAFKELVLVEVLKRSADVKDLSKLNQVAAEGIDPALAGVVVELMAIVRSSLRGQFSKIKQSDINSNTTLNELSAVLRTAGFKVGVEEVTNADVAKYNSEIQDGVDEILAAINNDPNKKGIDAIIENFVKNTFKQFSETKDPEFFKVKQTLTDESGRYLRDISERLKRFRRENVEAFEEVDNAFKAKALMNTLFSLEKTLEKIYNYMDAIEKSGKSDVDTLKEIAQYNYLLKGWQDFVETTQTNLLNTGVSSNSIVYSLVSRLNTAIDRGLQTFKKVQSRTAIDTTTTLLNEFSRKVAADIDKQIADLEKKSPSVDRDLAIKALKEKKEKYNFTKEKVAKIYKGEMGDANFWSSMFESYTTNPDPVIATFALFLKGQVQDIVNTAYTRSQEYMSEARPLMEKLGMDGVNHKEDWQEFLMVDRKPVFDKETGKTTYMEVLAFQAPVKDWRYGIAEFDQKIDEAAQSGNKDLLKEAIKNKQEHLSKYFNRKYTKTYYDAMSKLNEESPEAALEIELVNREIENFKNEYAGDVEMFLNNSVLDALYDKKKRLSSLYYEDGTPKNEKDTRIAEAIKRHQARTKKFYSSVEKKGAFQRAFESFADAIGRTKYASMVKFDDEGKITPEFKAVLDEWLTQNTVMKYTDAYYEDMEDIFTELEEVSKLMPEEYNVSKLYKMKSDLMIGYKDEYGHNNPTMMTPETRKNIMKKLSEIQREINEIQERAKGWLEENPEVAERQEELLSRLTGIRKSEPTSYYLDEINTYMSALNGPIFTAVNANNLLKSKSMVNRIDKLRADNVEFRKWFDENHIEVEYDTPKGTFYKYERLDAWNLRVLKDSASEKYAQTTTVTLGNNTFNVPGVPTSKYFYTTVKDSYVENGKTIRLRTIPKGISEEERNRDYVGKVITNRGEYLPLSKEQFFEQGRGQEYLNSVASNKKQDSLARYVNEDYYKLTADPDKKKLLDLTKEYHLANQLGIDRSQKLYLDLPRYPMITNLEKAQRGQLVKRWTDRIMSIGRGIAATLTGKSREEANIASRQEEDIVEEMTNPTAEEEYEKLAMIQDGLLNPIFEKMPIKGIQNLPMDKVSYDVIASLNTYMLQTVKQKNFNKISPIAQAMLSTLEDTDAGVDALRRIKEKAFSVNDAAKHLAKGDNKSVRAAAFRAFYNRELKGQMYSEKHLDWLNKVTAAITGGASLNYFALNLPSAIKNYWGILWQLNVEAIAGEYMDYSSLAKGKLRSKTAMNEWTTRIWGGKHDTLDTQLIMRLDPIQGKSEEVMVKDYSRTFESDLASISWIYSPRKFMEMEGGLQLFYSMLYHKKIPMTIDGTKRTISYADAFELDNKGRLVTKKGVDEKYGIKYNEDGTTELGEELKKFQNAVHEKFKDLNGVFAKYEQPQAQQFFAYRLFAFMRRYFTSMFMNRFGTERANFALETVRSGYYIESVKSLAKIITSLGKHASMLAPSERRALLKALVDVVQIAGISMIAAMLFGWDDDDEERFEKLRQKSGALGEDDFKLDGWLSNHALTLFLKTQAENQSFIPLPNLGLQNYLDFTSSASIAFNPTISSGVKLLTQATDFALDPDDEDLYYSKDVGPYSWQKEGELKMFNTLGKMIGLSGTQVSPVVGLQSWESMSR